MGPFPAIAPRAILNFDGFGALEIDVVVANSSCTEDCAKSLDMWADWAAKSGPAFSMHPFLRSSNISRTVSSSLPLSPCSPPTSWSFSSFPTLIASCRDFCREAGITVGPSEAEVDLSYAVAI